MSTGVMARGGRRGTGRTSIGLAGGIDEQRRAECSWPARKISEEGRVGGAEAARAEDVLSEDMIEVMYLIVTCAMYSTK